MQQRTCSIPDCDRRHDSRGWCYTHYQRWKRHGDPLYVSEAQQLRVGDAETRFLSKVIVLPDGCWQWTRISDGERYGQFSVNGQQPLAHR